MYNVNDFEGFDAEFYENVKQHKAFKEDLMLDPLFISNPLLNSTITQDEVNHAVMKAKNGKAVGVDKLPNEVFKNDCVPKALCALFQLCFESSKIPSDWLKAIILPIPKSSQNDPRIPLNYRGISLLSTTSKLFTSILNNRLLNYMESNNKFVDEQNGFRSKDHARSPLHPYSCV